MRSVLLLTISFHVVDSLCLKMDLISHMYWIFFNIKIVSSVINCTALCLYLQDPVCARRTPRPGLWSTPLTWSYPKGSPPLSTVKRRVGPPRQWSGTKTGSGWKRTKTTHVHTACCFRQARFSSCASFTDDGANPTREPTSAWPGTTWEKPSAVMRPWK